MFEPTPSAPPAQPQTAVPPRALVASRLPLELEHEFAEMRAAAPRPSQLPALLLGLLLFHALLIAERIALHMPAAIFVLRGLPVTALIASLVVATPAFRRSARGCGSIAMLPGVMAVALLARVPFSSVEQILFLQTGIALLMALAGLLLFLPRRWVLAGMCLALAADGVAIFLAPSGAPAAMLLQSCWAPAFGAALAVLVSSSRENEARRDFVLTRQAVFAGVPNAAADAEARHVDSSTGVANRVAFDMRFRAAWEHAANRRQSVALLFFAVDHLGEQKRDLGSRFSDLMLNQVGSCLQDGLRRSDDMVARFDGLHFVVMLPGVGVDGATQIAERLRGCVEELGIFAGQTRHKVTVTVGAASLRAKRGTPRDRLVDGGMQALEQGRAMGTNLVCVEGRGCVPAMS